MHRVDLELLGAMVIGEGSRRTDEVRSRYIGTSTWNVCSQLGQAVAISRMVLQLGGGVLEVMPSCEYLAPAELESRRHESRPHDGSHNMSRTLFFCKRCSWKQTFRALFRLQRMGSLQMLIFSRVECYVGSFFLSQPIP